MTQDPLPGRVARALMLTRIGLVGERLTRAFWPAWSLVALALGAVLLGAGDLLSDPWLIGLGAAMGLAILAALVLGLRALRWPSRAEARSRLDATLPGRPLQAIADSQAVGQDDPASAAVWAAHQARMAARAATARAPDPDLRVARFDPYALRYAALVVLGLGLLFGSVGRVQSIPGLGTPGSALPAGPTWEGWVEPPAYTRLPALYLGDQPGDRLTLSQGSLVTLRLYGAEGALSVRETISGNPLPEDAAARTATAQEFTVRKSGELAIEGPGGRVWSVVLRPDALPQIALDGEIETEFDGRSAIPFRASDDHGIVAGNAVMTLALDEVDRRYGRAVAPDPRPAIEVALPMPIAGDRTNFAEALIDDFSDHPWAHLPVQIVLRAEDAAGQIGQSVPDVIALPARRFFDPIAAALIDQRQALLWARANAGDVAMVLRAVSWRPEDVFRKPEHAETLKGIIEGLELAAADLDADQQEATAQALWDLALTIEQGDLQDARERLDRAQERLEEAMRNGASEQEIAELMQELREATEDYMRQLAQEQQRQAQQNPDGQQQQQMSPGDMQMTQNDLQEMMDRIQELMEQGRMAEAMEALEQLRQLMENMQVTEGQGQPSPGQQAMEGLADTLRQQQELSDEAFRDLQEQFNPDSSQNQGQQPGQQPQGNQPGDQPQGSQPGQGQQGQPGQPGTGGDQSLEQGLAERQRALRQELDRQSQNLPGAGTEAGERARENLDRAGEAMEGAEGALRDGDLPEAIDRQAEAMDALRDGMRDLGEAMAEAQQQAQGSEQGFADATRPDPQRDPLGRSAGTNGQVGTEENLLQDHDVYRRAQELLDEIRRRTGEGDRTEAERDYLERLLDRF